MDQQIPQTEPKKGLTKGCTVALIVGGVVVVLIAAAVILFIVNRDKVARWAYKMAVNTEKALIIANSFGGIDTVAVNKVADAFLKNLEAEEVDSEIIIPFAGFVQQFAGDTKMDSAEAVAFVQAMIECYPELAGLYQPVLIIDTTSVIDSNASGQ